MLFALLACADPPAPTAPALPDEAAVQAARTAPIGPDSYGGPWSVSVYAEDPEDAGARAFGAGIGLGVAPWDGKRPFPAYGEVDFLYVSGALPVATLVERLTVDGTPPRGDLVVVLAGTDRAWAQDAAARLPWTRAGVIDATASASLYTDPAALGRAPLGRVAARVAADHYGLDYVADAGPYPPGLHAVLAGAVPADLTAEDVRVRAGAAALLASDALAGDPEVAVRLAVAGHTTSAETLQALSLDRDPLVRARVAEVSADVAILSRLATDPSAVVRLVAAHHLAVLAPQGTLGAEAPLRQLAEAPDAYLRWKAAFGLGSTPAGTEVLVTLLDDVDADVRREAARSLGRRKDPSAIPALLKSASDPNSFVRRWVMEALSAFPTDPAAREALAVGAKDPTALVADAAHRGLGQEGPPWEPAPRPRNDAEIAAAAASPDATTRKDICKFMAGRPGSIPTLDTLTRDADGEVRKSAVEALGWFPEAAPQLFAALADPDPDVVVTALDALRRNRGGTVAAIAPLTRASDGEVRLRAWEALASLGPSPELEPGVADLDERVRAAVIAVYPDRLAADEPAVLVRRAAASSPGAGRDALVLAALPGAEAAWVNWARGVIAREDDLLHLRFSWNDPVDRPAPYRSLRPPVIRDYGHPNRG